MDIPLLTPPPRPNPLFPKLIDGQQTSSVIRPLAVRTAQSAGGPVADNQPAGQWFSSSATQMAGCKSASSTSQPAGRSVNTFWFLLSGIEFPVTVFSSCDTWKHTCMQTLAERRTHTGKWLVSHTFLCTSFSNKRRRFH